jgi:gas vesicle protein
MRHFNRFLFCAVLGVGLIFNGALLAAPQKVVRQKAKTVTTVDQAAYKQQVQQLRTLIRQDQQQLKLVKRQFGKNSPQIKVDREKLRKDEKTLKQLIKTRKKK